MSYGFPMSMSMYPPAGAPECGAVFDHPKAVPGGPYPCQYRQAPHYPHRWVGDDGSRLEWDEATYLAWFASTASQDAPRDDL